jgi:hypothetical protein
MYEEDETHDSLEESEEEYRMRLAETNRRIIKFGWLTDLLVATAVQMVIEEYFGQMRLECFAVRNNVPRGWNLEEMREFDIFAHSETHFFSVESPGRAEMPDAEAFVASLPALHEYFPEIDRRELVPIFAAYDVSDELLGYLTEHGVYCMDIDIDRNIGDTGLANFSAVQAARAKS